MRFKGGAVLCTKWTLQKYVMYDQKDREGKIKGEAMSPGF